MVCRVPECGVPVIHLRGLCRPCYVFAASLVFLGISSWQELEAAGCVGPALGRTQSPKRSERIAWFARGVGLSPERLSEEVRERTNSYELTVPSKNKKLR